MLRFKVVGLICAAVALGATPGARAATSVPLAVPLDVRIPVALTQMLTSQTAHPGDPFTFKTTKAENLGGLDVPSGTLGRGRVALASPAQGKSHGSLALQADSLDLPDGRTISVNVDVARPPHAHLSDKHTRFFVLPIPTVGIVPALVRSQSGNLVLDAGTGFGVVTVAPRSMPAPLYTLAPSASPSAAPSAQAAPAPASAAAAAPASPPAASRAPSPPASPSR